MGRQGGAGGRRHGHAAPAAPAAAAAAEPTEFNVILTGCGDKKIQVIKALREITNLGLKEAKEVVEGVPKPIKESVSKDEAEYHQEEDGGGGRHRGDQAGIV